ncbi:NADPH-dependent FMN reductase [Sphingomonas edaphi]|uniref:NAD(P)H-dependent oxidoreductase n=1 Tax=Sphingomonas edaphi TaxID=2315689 RepID=A0A418PYI8_9SPHN|nr:NADPH-dependent FMN reductase [Sphingomonas edaphi]RIX27117.1 NAD(P)H-dependent oxidoreductase [Sphingomonas edaphi]
MMSTSLLGLSGSLRANSYSTGILTSLQEKLSGDLHLAIHSLADVPLYNQDLDGPDAPRAVAELRDAIAAADGLVLVTPEFNYGMPGVLKNALDWASRPYGSSSLIGKPVITLSASPAFTGGVRAQAQLHETLLATQSVIVPRPQTVIGEVHTKFQNGRLVDQPSLDFAVAAVRDLQNFARGRTSRLAA